MLEERWRAVVAAHSGEDALRDAATGDTWTFSELAAAADRSPQRAPEGIVFPTGQGPEFILTVLRAWRAGAIVCPLEVGQPKPNLSRPPSGISHLKLTSGTTGQAKCIAFTAAQLAADADAIVATMGLDRACPNLGVLSLAHSYGFSNLVLPLLLHGIPLALTSSPLPAALMAAAQCFGNQSVTLPGVPALWRAWQESASIPANVRLAISAGAVLPLGLETAVFAGSGLKVHNFLGASECGGIAYDRSSVPRNDPAWVGQALEGVRLDLDEHGRLQVFGPAVGDTYWPEFGETLGHGRYQTSDLADLAPDGGVFLRGRAGDVIHVAGRKVTPEAIEVVLRQHPEVRECLVLSVPAEEPRGETIVAIVEGGGGLTGAHLRDFLLARLPVWQVPRLWRFVPELTSCRRGKLSRTEWRARWLEGHMAEK